MKGILIILIIALVLNLVSTANSCVSNNSESSNRCDLSSCDKDSECFNNHCREILMGKKICLYRARVGDLCAKNDDCDSGRCSSDSVIRKCLAKDYTVVILVGVIVGLLAVGAVVFFIMRKRNNDLKNNLNNANPLIE